MTILKTEKDIMEKQLFDWDGWDDLGTASFQFYNAVLKVPMGEFSIGDKFDTVSVDFQTGEISLYRVGENPVFRGKLKLSLLTPA